ncbi:hypothetical protein TNCV_1452141 [Trichonephila clavipes]|nr:hypothetical protein TNCV_1452141 [Trichonephila clavipes]
MGMSFTQWLPKPLHEVYRALCRYRMQTGNEWFPWSLQTRMRPTEYYIQNWDSGNRLSLHCIVKGSRSNDPHVDSLRCCKCRRAVRVDTRRAASIRIS